MAHPSRPQVSVVIPTRDRRELLSVTLRSVLAQTGVDLEVVVVDDGSTDRTTAWLDSLRDARVRVVRHDAPQGVSATRNDGIGNARAPWVALLDDDDVWAPGKLAAQLSAAGDASWVYSGAVAVDDELEIVDGFRPLAPHELCRRLPLYNPVPAGSSNVLVRAALYAQVGPFDTTLRHMADWDMWRRLAAASLPVCVDRPLVAYRMHRGNASLDTPQIVAEAAAIERRYGTPIDWVAVHRWIGASSMRRGRRGAAARHFIEAARLGDRRSALRAVNALVHPRVGRKLFFRPFSRDRDYADDDWKEAADRWLRTLRAG